MIGSEISFGMRNEDDEETWRPPFTVGQVLEHAIAFTPENVRAFAVLTDDTNPLHHDADWAATTRFGGLIASGTQTTGLLLGSLARHIFPQSASLGLGCSFRLRRAVPASCVLVARWTVLTLAPKPSLGGMIADLEGGLFREGVAYVEATASIAVMPHQSLHRASGPAPKSETNLPGSTAS
jgi:acyl dehydratase